MHWSTSLTYSSHDDFELWNSSLILFSISSRRLCINIDTESQHSKPSKHVQKRVKVPSLTTLYTNKECQSRGNWMWTTCPESLRSRARPGIELAPTWSQVRRPTVAPPLSRPRRSSSAHRPIGGYRRPKHPGKLYVGWSYVTESAVTTRLQSHSRPQSTTYHTRLITTVKLHCLQCSDAVGWAAGRASGL